VSDLDMRLWAEIVARLYEVDFHPINPPTVTVRPKPDLAALLRVVRVPRADPDDAYHEPIDDIWAARVLIAQDFDTVKASQVVQAYVAWRRNFRGLVVPSQAWVDYAIVIVPFEDVRGRPVAISRLRSYHPGLPLDMMTNGYRATADGVIAHMLMSRSPHFSRTNPLEQWVLCIDCTGIGWSNFSMEYIRMFVRESQERYMERISVIYMLNPPSSWRLMWAMMKPLLHPRTLRKIRLVPSQEVPVEMRKLLGDRADALLPPNYGGSAPHFPPPGHGRTLDEKVGALLAKTWRHLGVQLHCEEDLPQDSAQPSRKYSGRLAAKMPRSALCCGWLECVS